MNSTIEKLENNQVKISVVVPAADVDVAIAKAYKDYSQRLNIPGFRKGHAPRPVIDNAMGGKIGVMIAVSDALVNDNYPQLIEDNDLYPTGKPELVGEEANLAEEGKDYAFAVKVPVKPVFELSSYDAVEIELPAEGASEQEIDEQITYFAEHYYTFEDAGALAMIEEGNRVVLNITTKTDGGRVVDALTNENFTYTLGSKMMPEEFDKALLGLLKNEEKHFDIKVPSEPMPYTKDLIGNAFKLIFDIKVVSIASKQLPVIDDEWAKNNMGMDSLAELRERMAESIVMQKEQYMPRLKENRAVEALAERLQGEPDEASVSSEESELLQNFFRQLQDQGVTFDQYLKENNLDSQTFKSDIKKQAYDRVKENLALDAYAAHNDIKATPEEISAEFAKSGVEDPAALEAEWRSEGRLFMVREAVVRGKAIDRLVEEVKVTVAGEKKPAAKKAAAKKAAPKKAAAKKTKAAKDEAAADAVEAPAEAPAEEVKAE